jgi:prefoldin alpha subunit
MEEELKEMGRQLEALSGAKSRFISARNNLDDMNNNTKTDQPLLVPLSSSLYVPGKIDNPNKVIVGNVLLMLYYVNVMLTLK